MVTPITIFIIFHFSTNQTLIVYLGMGCAVLTFCIGLISALYGSDNQTAESAECEGDTDTSDTTNIEISGYKIYCARAVAAFLAAVITNYLASIGLGILSGFMSVFPALFTVLMVSLWLVHGDGLPVQSAGPLLLGITSINIFALLTAYFYLFHKVFEDDTADLAFSVSIGWAVSVFCGGLPMLVFMKYLEKRGKSVFTQDKVKQQQLSVMTDGTKAANVVTTET